MRGFALTFVDTLEAPAACERGRGTKRIAVLDGYRALAIMAVMGDHYVHTWTAPVDPQAHIPISTPLSGLVIFHYGWLGVQFFFVISGFVILMTLERCRNLGDFVIRRFARLWPPLFVAATLTTVVMALIGPPDWVVSRYDYLTSILILDPFNWMIARFHPGMKWVDGAYWSLWVEVRFYALAALFYLAVRRSFIKFWLVFQAAVATVTLLHLAHGKTALFMLDTLCFPDFLPYFTLGVCLYEIYSEGRLSRLAVFGALFGAALIFVTVATQHDVYRHAHLSMWVPVMGNFFILVLFYLFVTDDRLVGVFASRPMVAIGQASYSLYLIHQYIGVAIIRRAVLSGVPYLVALPLTAGLMIGAALLLFRYVEVPAKSVILKRSQPWVGRIGRRLPWLSYRAAVVEK